MKSQYSKSLVWLRRDLRIHDQRAFYEATHQSKSVQPVFVIDQTILKGLPKEDRRCRLIQDCIDELDRAFREKGGQLIVVVGDPVREVPRLAEELNAQAVFLNHDYEPSAKERDEKVNRALTKKGIHFHSFKDQVIFEKREILNGSNEPYRVFTPYSKTWLKKLESDKALHLASYPPNLRTLSQNVHFKNATFAELGFTLPEISFVAGEEAARKSLREFAKNIANYHEARDYPAIHGTSALSPHFRFGTLSIREAVRFCYEHFSVGAKTWLNELIWREFYMMILDQFPYVENQSFKAEYAEMKWPGKKEHFEAWCEGRTGYPIVDAAMRQLNQTGWMHNRLRMIAAMFLTKDLLIDWRLGERYFALQLLDYDLAANNGGWQWSASTGCDAQPYFRIMNPISQSEKFDRNGDFIRHYVPELKGLNSKEIHWPQSEPGLNGYPDPIVDHSAQRQKALALFKK